MNSTQELSDIFDSIAASDLMSFDVPPAFDHVDGAAGAVPRSTTSVLDEAVDLVSSSTWESPAWLFDNSPQEADHVNSHSYDRNYDQHAAGGYSDITSSTDNEFNLYSTTTEQSSAPKLPEPTPIEPSRVQVVHNWCPKDSLATNDARNEAKSLIQLFRPILYPHSSAATSARKAQLFDKAGSSAGSTLRKRFHPTPADVSSGTERLEAAESNQYGERATKRPKPSGVCNAGDLEWIPFPPEVTSSGVSTTKKNASRRSSGIAKQNAARSPTSTAVTMVQASSSSTTLPREPKFRTFQEDLWSFRFQELLRFRDDHGHCLVPTKYVHNLQLSQWVKRQRYHYKLRKSGAHSNLTAERQQALDDIGFCWDMHSALWEERLQELIAYKAQHGDCNVRCHYSKNPQLAVWVKYQRRQYKLLQESKPSNMTHERIGKLNKLGFVWHCRPGSSASSNSNSSSRRK